MSLILCISTETFMKFYFTTFSLYTFFFGRVSFGTRLFIVVISTKDRSSKNCEFTAREKLIMADCVGIHPFRCLHTRAMFYVLHWETDTMSSAFCRYNTENNRRSLVTFLMESIDLFISKTIKILGLTSKRFSKGICWPTEFFGGKFASQSIDISMPSHYLLVALQMPDSGAKVDPDFYCISAQALYV